MDKMVKKLTERELIDHVLAWYELNRTSDELRETISAYLGQERGDMDTEAAQCSVDDPSMHGDLQAAHSQEFSQEFGEPREPVEYRPAVAAAATKKVEAKEAVYVPQFEPTDEIIASRGLMLDTWAIYYATEEFFNRISFGLLNMHSLALLFCLAVSGAVMFGAWQSSQSIERQKKAAFKSMDIEALNKKRTPSLFSELDSEPKDEEVLEKSQNEEIASDPMPAVPAEESPLVAALDPAMSEPTESAATLPESTSVEAETVGGIATSTVADVPELQEILEPAPDEFAKALSLFASGEWQNALVQLQELENSGRCESKSLLTLLQIEACIQLKDADSRELGRQLLMNFDPSQHELLYELQAARWILMGTKDERLRFLSESASLPESVRQRMTLWAQIRNGNKDALIDTSIADNASKGPGRLCDLLFAASYHFNVGGYDSSFNELMDAKQMLCDLPSPSGSKAEEWLLEASRTPLLSKIEDIIVVVSQKLRNQIH